MLQEFIHHWFYTAAILDLVGIFYGLQMHINLFKGPLLLDVDQTKFYCFPL